MAFPVAADTTYYSGGPYTTGGRGRGEERGKAKRDINKREGKGNRLSSRNRGG